MTDTKQKPDLEQSLADLLENGKPVRLTLASGARVHIDRPLPFICVHEFEDDAAQAAYEVTTSNASYLVAPNLSDEVENVNTIIRAMIDRFGACLLIVVGELEQDVRLTDDSPFLPEFDVFLQTNSVSGTKTAAKAVETAINEVKVKYRSPDVQLSTDDDVARHMLPGLKESVAVLSIRFAPIYRQPDGEAIYPDLKERLVANIFDALLHGAAAFSKEKRALNLPTHRALGRRTFVDAVRKLDSQIDKISSAFDFLLLVTPINTSAAWTEFQSKETAPELLYRPLTIEVDAAKSALHSVSFQNLEDPVLYDIYRAKQQELDLQLTAIDLRGTPRFREASRLLYGPVEPELLELAKTILKAPAGTRGSSGEGGNEGFVDCHELAAEASSMIAKYNAAYSGFDAEVVIRDDLPAGMMVSGPCLMISRATRMTRQRVQALLSHEIGVHLMTYFNGDAQGLKIFRTGLAGYEGVQEGLAVFAEYLTGGLTPGRMRLLAARVVGCAAMLNGASFVDTYRMMTREYGFSDSAAFNLTVRLYRSGGLAKDAIYLRGLKQILDHVQRGYSLDPFWLGKFSHEQLGIIEELAERGLLKHPPVRPAFLEGKDADERLAAAQSGKSPIDLIFKKETSCASHSS